MPDAPDLRILQANERTLLAWVRTGLTLMAFGFVVARLTVWLRLEHPERGDGTFGSLLGIAIIALGIACHVLAAIRFISARRAIVEGRSLQPSATGPVAIAVLVAGIGIAAIGYVIVGAD